MTQEDSQWLCLTLRWHILMNDRPVVDSLWEFFHKFRWTTWIIVVWCIWSERFTIISCCGARAHTDISFCHFKWPKSFNILKMSSSSLCHLSLERCASKDALVRAIDGLGINGDIYLGGSLGVAACLLVCNISHLSPPGESFLMCEALCSVLSCCIQAAPSLQTTFSLHT